MNYDDTYEFLKKIDKGIASDYLMTKAKNKALQDILDEVRTLLDVGPGKSILEAIKADAGPATLATVEPQIRRTTERKRSVVSKEEREDIRRRLLLLGVSTSPKDSSKRLLSLLQRVREPVANVPKDVRPSIQQPRLQRHVQKPIEKKEPTKETPSEASNNNVVSGW